MKIGLDLYGVIANHLAEKAAFAKTVWGLDISERGARREAMIARLGKEGYRAFARAFSQRPLEQRLNAPLYPGVRETLAALYEEGDRFALISMRHTMGLEPFVHAYVQKHQLPIKDIVVVTADAEKVGACHRSGVAVFFDDNRSVLKQLVPLKITLVWANFYRITSVERRFRIAHSWKEFAAIVRAIRKE